MFATPSDVEDRWRPLTPEETIRAQALIADASALIRSECPSIDDRLDADPPTLDPQVPLMVVCAMVKRVLIAGAGIDGASSHQQTAGPFSQSVSFTNPLGNLYLTKAERRMLGCGGQKAFTIDTAIRQDEPFDPFGP